MADNRLQLKLGARDETQAAFRTLKSSLATTNTAFANLTKVAAGLGVVFGAVFIRDLLEVNKKFQNLKSSLTSFTNSVDDADTAFNILKDFAKTTPFALSEVVDGFNVLVSRGITPTVSQLGVFADISAGTSKSIMQFAEAVADASVSEFERLKEFGIKAGKEGDKITFSIGDLTKTVNNDADSILAALTEIGEIAFSGAAERQALTLGGAITNLRDNVDEFQFAVGEAGLGAALVKTIRKISEFISGNNALAQQVSNKLVYALLLMDATLVLVFDNLKMIGTVLDVVFGVFVIRKILAVGNQIIKFTRAIVQSQIVLTAVRIATQNWKVTLAAAAAGIAVTTLATDNLKEKAKEQLKTFLDSIKITNLFETAMNSLGLELVDIEAAAAEFTAESGNMKTGVTSVNKTLPELVRLITGATGQINTGAAATADYTAAFNRLQKKFAPVTTALSELGEETEILEQLFASGKITSDEMTDALNQMARESLGLDTTMEDLNDRQTLLDQALATNIISAKEYENAVADVTSAMVDLNAETEKSYGAGAIKGVKDYYEAISDNAANMADFVTGSFDSLEDTLSDFFQTGKLDFGTFTDAIKKGLADLAAKAVITTGLNFLGDVFPTLNFADGGMVPGSGGPRADDVLARVSSGEYVVNAASVNKFGTGFFDAVNAGKMPGGGMGISKGIMESITPGFFLGGIIKDTFGIDFDLIGIIEDVIDDISDAISDVIGVVTDAIRGMVEGIMSGDLTTIAALALPFVLPGIGSAVFANLGAGQGFAAAVGNGMSSSFASGILGSGASLSSIATSVGIEFAKDSFTDMLSSSLSDMILGVTGGMGRSKGSFSTNRSDSFANLYSEASPYLAGMTGANVHAGDSVRVGERGEEMFIPQRDGTIAPIKGNASDLIGAVNEMKDEIVTLRRQMSRMMAGSQLAGVRS